MAVPNLRLWARGHFPYYLFSLPYLFTGNPKDEEDKASVYFFISREQGFSNKPDIQFNNIGQVEQFITKDLNNDGISDLVVLSRKKDTFKIFLSKRK